MNHKTKILVTGRTMDIGGVEKALLALLNTMDFDKNEIYFLLMKDEGAFLKDIDSRVIKLKTPEFFSWVMLPKERVLQCAFSLLLHPVWLFHFIKCILWGTLIGNMAQARQRMWKAVVNTLPEMEGNYDVALDFSGLMRHYMLEKIHATQKYTWIHSDYRVFGLDKTIDEPLLTRYDGICCVSDTCKDIFDAEFPALKDKSKVELNKIDLNYICKQMVGKGFDDGFDGVRLLDVTRIDPNKGLDIAVRVCSKLKEMGFHFRWYILGNDPLGYRAELEKLIEEHDVKDCFILLGFTSNPYPYMNDADLIVHFSRFEGRSVSIDEALALKKKILLTNYPTAKDQITHGVNGYICDFEEDKLVEMIKELIR